MDNERRTWAVRRVLAACLCGFAAGVLPAAAQSCPSWITALPNANALYLYYAPADDAAFPNWLSSGGVPTSPLEAFVFADLDPSIGTAAQLRDRVEQLVEAGYCEFDVDVRTVTSAPTPAEPRWQIVGIGSDTNGTGLSGIAQDVDTGDADAQDYARFWVGEFQDWTGAELTGAGSTLERWSIGLADLICHESGHNYGAAHNHAIAEPGEDVTVNHFMANPALGADPDSIVDALNHFSDTSYEVLGHNIGLTIKTVHNWDFVNPNGSNADSLVIRLLSNAPTLTIGWWYNGATSPWSNPTVVDSGSTQAFQGTTYKVFRLTFSTPKSWSGGADGVVPPDVLFHIGASFTQPDPVVVFDTTLRSGGSDLTLRPRMFGYDAGAGSDFRARFFNPNPEAGELILRDLEVVFTPRLIDIETMVAGARPLGMNGLPAATYERRKGRRDRAKIPTRQELRRRTFKVGREPLVIPLATLTDPRHVDMTYGPKDCEGRRPVKGSGSPAFGPPGTADYCPKGTALSLYPATYTYISATVIDPRARHWDREKKQYVSGPVASRLFFQVAGTVPDANRNGIDDLLDIRSGRSRDANGDGEPDEAQKYPVRRQ